MTAAGGRRLVVEADGGSRGNPGPAGFGAVVLDAASENVLAEVAESIGRATNNVAEYRGLLAGLRAAARIDPDCVVEVRMDSKLVVEQMSGRWQIRHEDLRRWADEARGVLPAERVSYTWIPRARNVRADALANAAMDAAAQGRVWTSSAAIDTSTGPDPADSGLTVSTSSSFDGTAGVSVTVSASTASTASTSRTTSTSASPTVGPPVVEPPVEASVPGPDVAGGPESARAPRAADVGDPTVLLVVRHGRTAFTEQGRFSGRGGVDPDLSEAGRADAVRVAEVLAGLRDGADGNPFADAGPVAHVVSSPAARTRGTAEIVADRLGLPVDLDDDWQEIGFGAWDGLTYREVAARWPAELAAWQGSATAVPPGGESLLALVARIRAARARLVSAHPARTVVVVTHATPTRAVVQEALDAGPAALWRTRIAPCSVTAVRYWTDGGIELATLNRVP